MFCFISENSYECVSFLFFFFFFSLVCVGGGFCISLKIVIYFSRSHGCKLFCDKGCTSVCKHFVVVININ